MDFRCVSDNIVISDYTTVGGGGGGYLNNI